MLSIRILSLALVCTGLLAGCSESNPPATSTPAASTAAPAPAATTPAPAPAAADPAPPAATAAAVTGIAACDDFLSAYEQCVTAKIPEASRAAMQGGLDQWKASWKSMAENAATRDTLPQVCQQAREASVPALQAYGCTL